MWGGIFNLAVEGLAKYSRSFRLFMVLICSCEILPLIQGDIADNVSFIASYWVIFIGFGHLLFYALYSRKHVNKDIPA